MTDNFLYKRICFDFGDAKVAFPKNKRRQIKAIIALTILLISTGFISVYAVLQAPTGTVEVKEPLEILSFDSELSFYPGETLQFNVLVENHASVSYNASLIFSLNDTAYQQHFITFSNKIYEIQSGTNNLEALLSVANTAPATELELRVNVTRDITVLPTPTPSQTPSPTSSPTSVPSGLDPSLTLFAAGTTWAANNGKSVLYINWYDNYCAHNTSNSNLGPWWREGQLPEIKNVTVDLLEQLGFDVTCVGDVPTSLSGYDLVIFEAWFAVEPKHVQLVREYMANGGNIVIIGGVPCYFATNCKDLWPYVTGGMNLASLSDWFGSSQFANTGGTATLSVDKPFGTALSDNSIIYQINGYSCYALRSMNSDAKILARWADGSVYSFTYEFGKGRVFYQAEMVW